MICALVLVFTTMFCILGSACVAGASTCSPSTAITIADRARALIAQATTAKAAADSEKAQILYQHAVEITSACRGDLDSLVLEGIAATAAAGLWMYEDGHRAELLLKTARAALGVACVSDASAFKKLPLSDQTSFNSALASYNTLSNRVASASRSYLESCPATGMIR